LTRATDDSQSSDSTDASKTFVNGTLSWYKDDNAGNPLGGATFTVCETDSYSTATNSFGNIADVCHDVTDNAGLDQNGTGGVFKLTGLALGKYSVVEKTAPAGYSLDSTTKYAQIPVSTQTTLTDSDNRNAIIETHFVDNRPVVKVTAFGYTNAPAKTAGDNLCAPDSPTSGVLHGCAEYTVTLHNYGGASTSVDLTLTITEVSTGTLRYVSNNGSPAGTVSNSAGNCPCTVSWTAANSNAISLAANGDATITVKIRYDNTDGTKISADLTANYTTNDGTRTASGSGANVTFPVHGD
jgi:hypothetical protein